MIRKSYLVAATHHQKKHACFIFQNLFFVSDDITNFIQKWKSSQEPLVWWSVGLNNFILHCWLIQRQSHFPQMRLTERLLWGITKYNFWSNNNIYFLKFKCKVLLGLLCLVVMFSLQIHKNLVRLLIFFFTSCLWKRKCESEMII